MAAPGDLLTPTLTDHRPRARAAGALPWRLGSLVYPAILGGPVAAALVAVLNGRRLGVTGREQAALAAAGLLATAAAVAVAALVDSDVTRVLVAVCGLAVYGVAHRTLRTADRVHATFSPHADPEDDYDLFLMPGLAAIAVGLIVLGILVVAVGGPA